MNEHFKRSKLLFWSLEILIVVAIIYFCNKISFIFSPIGIFISTVFVPILVAGALFYMLNPIVELLMKIHYKKFRVGRTTAVAIIFIAFLGALVYLGVSFIPNIFTQVTNLFNQLPDVAESTEKTIEDITNHGWLQNIDITDYINQIQTYLTNYTQNVLSSVTTSLGNIISMATSVVIVIITVPVILFYMLKDGHKLMPTIKKMIPADHQKQTISLLGKMNETIARYIGGQMIECLFVGIFTSLGYVFIGQKYALLLGVFAGVCNIIPYVGPYIGILPSLLVAFSNSVTQVIYVIIVVLIVQQLDGNLVYPNVIGKSLQIHPLTIIVILLAAGNISGLIGMILAIPLYAVVKVVVQYLYNIWLVQHNYEIKNDPRK
ncbi:AI-2E family transporter [Nicoliella spurrieriana]|uniref:AI-2E family transporter n=1 Tax=Nicoliella spurrieriana TaxID=2925830 RepID=A0A976RRH2_9LACO|nr:AI-2E family transporter [Nicoliella spurrieriana]UQS86410.1 AI-2E family transporter [Nicoliella spurrieriana]